LQYDDTWYSLTINVRKSDYTFVTEDGSDVTSPFLHGLINGFAAEAVKQK